MLTLTNVSSTSAQIGQTYTLDELESDSEYHLKIEIFHQGTNKSVVQIIPTPFNTLTRPPFDIVSHVVEAYKNQWNTLALTLFDITLSHESYNDTELILGYMLIKMDKETGEWVDIVDINPEALIFTNNNTNEPLNLHVATHDVEWNHRYRFSYVITKDGELYVNGLSELFILGPQPTEELNVMVDIHNISPNGDSFTFDIIHMQPTSAFYWDKLYKIALYYADSSYNIIDVAYLWFNGTSYHTFPGSLNHTFNSGGAFYNANDTLYFVLQFFDMNDNIVQRFAYMVDTSRTDIEYTRSNNVLATPYFIEYAETTVTMVFPFNANQLPAFPEEINLTLAIGPNKTPYTSVFMNANSEAVFVYTNRLLLDNQLLTLMTSADSPVSFDVSYSFVYKQDAWRFNLT